MVQITSSRTIGGLYTFANDPASGAIGAVALGVFLPTNSITKRFLIKCIQTFTSTGLSTLSFTLVGATITTTLFVPTGFAAFTTGTVISGVDFNANPFSITEPCQVFMNIGTIAITAGQITFNMDYNENSI